MADANGQTPRDLYIAELRAQIERLTALLATVESDGENLAGAAGAGAISRRVDTQVRPDSFFGMTTPGAVRKFLEMSGKGNPQSAPAIAEALVRGGLDKPENLDAVMKNVYTAFKRGKDTDFVKIGKVWGLVEWYPNRKPVESKPAKSKKKPRGKRDSAEPGKPSNNGLAAYNQYLKEQVAAGKNRGDAIAEWRKAHSKAEPAANGAS